MNPVIVEGIGIVATLLILVSMLFNTTSLKGSLAMRYVNFLGSVIFVVYGFLIPAISTAILNICLVFINAFYIVKLYRDVRKHNSISKDESLDSDKK